MRKRTSFALFVAIACTTLGMAFQQANAKDTGWRDEHCRYQSLQRGRWTRTEVRLTIECAAAHFPVSVSTAMAIAERESGLRHDARNPRSGACGVFQWYPASTTGGRVAQFMRGRPAWDIRNDSCTNARANTLWSVWYAHRWGWGPWED